MASNGDAECVRACLFICNATEARPMPEQGRHKGGAEGANAPSIFGRLYHPSQIFEESIKFATGALD